MTRVDRDLTVTVAGEPHVAPEDARIAWADRSRGVARVSYHGRTVTAIVEGAGSEWVVTLFGRRVPVSVQNRRERLLAAEVSHRAATGPVTVNATLPGLIVRVAVEEGSEVEEAAALVTIEAMKMQNEVRAPRAGRVIGLTAEAGKTVRTGEPLLRIE